MNLLFGILYTTQRRDGFCSWHWAAPAPLCGQSETWGRGPAAWPVVNCISFNEDPIDAHATDTQPNICPGRKGHSSGWIPLALIGPLKHSISDHRNTGENSKCFLQQPKQPPSTSSHTGAPKGRSSLHSTAPGQRSTAGAGTPNLLWDASRSCAHAGTM